MANIFREFLDLLPARPLQVGTVLAASGSQCTVELPGGGILQARGSASVGAQVFVRDGLIEGAAPGLTVTTMEV